MEQRTDRLYGFAAVAALCLFALWFASTLTNVYSDDAQISLRYAQRLLEGDGLTWTDGERVEGYSNFLWLMMAAGLGVFGVDLMVATRIFGVIGLIGLITFVSLGDDGRPDPRRALSGGAFIAVSGGFAVWAIGGLAHTFLAMVGVAALYAIRKSEQRSWLIAGSALLATATLLRVDGFILAGAILGGTLLKTFDWRRVATLAIGPGLAAVGQEIFRVLYYDDWVPNTARVKVSFTYERAEVGFWWTADALMDHGPLVVLAIGAAIALRRKSLDALVPALLWAAYAAYVGGDIFRGWRMLLPGLPMFAVLVADAAPLFHRFLWPVIGLLVVGQGVWNLRQEDAYRVPGTPDWTITTQAVAEDLRIAFEGRDPFLAVDAAGALPYFTGFNAVDMLGLTDRYLPRNPPPHWGKGGIGHDLGDGNYIWGKKPDIIAFRSGLGGPPSFLSGRQLAARPDWGKSYQRSFVESEYEGRPVRGMFFFRLIDGPAAPVRRSAHEVLYPGHLFGTPDHPAVLRNGRLGPLIPPGKPLVVELDLPEGNWNVTLLGSGPMASPATIEAPPRGPAKLRVRAKGAPAHLAAIQLTRDTAHAQLNEKVEGHFLGQNWNRARQTEAERMAELEALGYVSGTEPPPPSIGVLRHTENAFPGLNLYVSGHDNRAYLMDMKGNVLHEWSKPWTEAFPEDAAAGAGGAAFFRRVHLFPDGSLLAVYDGYGLVKLDRDSNLLWVWKDPAHHDLEVLPDGRIWTLTRKARRIPRINKNEPVLEDFAVLLSADGKELKRVSVLEGLERSPASKEIFANREENFADVLHTNSLEVLHGNAKNPLFSEGRLLLSSRSISSIFVLDPETGDIVWAHEGQYAFQHDPGILPNGNLLLFDNSGPGGLASAVREYDPSDMHEVWSFVGSDAEPFFSRYCGSASRLPNGNTLMVESGVGRVIERTPAGAIAWEWSSPHRTGPHDDYVAIIPDMVRIPPERVPWIPREKMTLSP